MSRSRSERRAWRQEMEDRKLAAETAKAEGEAKPKKERAWLAPSIVIGLAAFLVVSVPTTILQIMNASFDKREAEIEKKDLEYKNNTLTAQIVELKQQVRREEGARDRAIHEAADAQKRQSVAEKRAKDADHHYLAQLDERISTVEENLSHETAAERMKYLKSLKGRLCTKDSLMQ